MESKPITCEPFFFFVFMAQSEKKSSLSWMFTKCLQAIFAQVFVTVKVMEPVATCIVLWYLWKKKAKCMCCNICIEINYVHVACNVLIHASFMITEVKIQQFEERRLNASSLLTAVKSISVWENQSSACDPDGTMDRREIGIFWKCFPSPFEAARRAQCFK